MAALIDTVLRDMKALLHQGGFDDFRWRYCRLTRVGPTAGLSGAQSIDGLVLGETTPGPLIMVVAFVGAGVKAIFWPHLVLLAGVVGAGVATFCIFLLSFLFILAGAPLVESPGVVSSSPRC